MHLFVVTCAEVEQNINGPKAIDGPAQNAHPGVFPVEKQTNWCNDDVVSDHDAPSYVPSETKIGLRLEHDAITNSSGSVVIIILTPGQGVFSELSVLLRLSLPPGQLLHHVLQIMDARPQEAQLFVAQAVHSPQP
eukprot:CAMPEP_0172939298 /NCGR_PEP_ID=MMETSP1075-20121228/223460_1 /TAXON_ID=2916 /ORGANISM="Ceratium fusus, Strain PA161109" /LENGTH=134 /DNA_ID=CAMNT_0013800687 /DNA_START=362 /DNA_END=766 /DNA_ORIENTATION=-